MHVQCSFEWISPIESRLKISCSKHPIESLRCNVDDDTACTFVRLARERPRANLACNRICHLQKRLLTDAS